MSSTEFLLRSVSSAKQHKTIIDLSGLKVQNQALRLNSISEYSPSKEEAREGDDCQSNTGTTPASGAD